jgi:hypothetical protein
MDIKPVLMKGAEALRDEVPGASAIEAGLLEIIRQRNAKKAHEYLSNVAALVLDKQGEEAGPSIMKLMHEEWAAETVERGYRAILDAVVLEARMCITALVAEHLNANRSVDRIYRRAAILFSDCTCNELLALRALAETAIKVLAHVQRGGTASVEIPHQQQRIFRVFAVAADSTKTLEPCDLPQGFTGAVRTLIRAGFGSNPPSGSTMAGVNSGNVVAIFAKGDEEGLQVLRSCLSVLPSSL